MPGRLRVTAHWGGRLVARCGLLGARCPAANASRLIGVVPGARLLACCGLLGERRLSRRRTLRWFANGLSFDFSISFRQTA